MFCTKCGKQNQDQANFCIDCGAMLKNSSAYTQTVDNEAATFSASVATCFSKAFQFRGRASRAEFWWFALFNLLASMIAGILDQAFYGEPAAITAITNLVIVFPSLSVNIRRLHDTGHSGWWYLILFTIIGAIPYFIWMVSKGDDVENEYGMPSSCQL